MLPNTSKLTLLVFILSSFGLLISPAQGNTSPEQADFAQAMKKVKSGDYGEAKTLFSALLEQYPEMHRVRLELALVCAKLGDIEQAQAHLQQVLDQPDIPVNVQHNIERLLARLERKQERKKVKNRHKMKLMIDAYYGFNSNVRFGADNQLDLVAGEIGESGLFDDFTHITDDIPIDFFDVEPRDIALDPPLIDESGVLDDYYEQYVIIHNPEFTPPVDGSSLDDGTGLNDDGNLNNDGSQTLPDIADDGFIFTENGYFDAEGNFHPFIDGSQLAPSNKKNNAFVESRLQLEHEVRPNLSALRWRNQFSLKRTEQLELNQYDETNYRFSSTLSWDWTPFLRTSIGASYRQIERDVLNLVNYKGVKIEALYLLDWGLIDVGFDHLVKDYHDGLYDQFDARYNAISLGWGKYVIGDTFFISLQGKYAENDNRGKITDYQSQSFGLQGFYQINPKWDIQSALSWIKFDYDYLWQEQYLRLNSRLTYHLDTSLQWILSAELADRNLTDGLADDDRYMAKIGFRWRYD
ncbi:hypothetical protein OLMES_3867 [Oleiphilus messinensis]|uniref:Uncharacterized protein n=1 Tax=Oleiphilus messinensis TaxID=141451 RepID=A0A1Y0IBJ3_9GAMM|nr:tetratricopeptide repeat protein [Oleiphilus messinensis]ARU57887.1 hypothetical protein OLMES_3867 [Oleiphilus messinensis]